MTASARPTTSVRRLCVASLLVVLFAGCSEAAPDRTPDSATTTDISPDRVAEVVAWEQAQVRVRTCLQDKGFDVPVAADGEWELNVPAGEDGVDRARQALGECREIAEVPEPIPLTDGEMRTMYQLLVASHTCLEELGYPLEDPPSEETFVAIYELSQSGQSPEAPWSPYVEIEVTTTIESACPQPELIDLAGAP